jgi:hypothetical protein
MLYLAENTSLAATLIVPNANIENTNDTTDQRPRYQSYERQPSISAEMVKEHYA